MVQGRMLAIKLLAVLCVALNRQADGFQFSGAYQTSGMPLSNRCVTACSQQRQVFSGRHRRSSSSSTHRASHREGFFLQRGGLYLRRLLLEKSWLRSVGKQPGSVQRAFLAKARRGTPQQSQQSQQQSQQQSLRSQQPREGEGLAHSGALVALPLLGRLFAQASNLFQVGVLFGTVPTLLAGLVCCYWAWQVSNTEYLTSGTSTCILYLVPVHDMIRTYHLTL